MRPPKKLESILQERGRDCVVPSLDNTLRDSFAVQICSIQICRTRLFMSRVLIPSAKVKSQLTLACFFGGEGGIRTLERVAPLPDFESGTFNHSATSPSFVIPTSAE